MGKDPQEKETLSIDRKLIDEVNLKHVGPYKILEELGEGGMGTVYLAEQSQPVRRRVALKIMKPGMDSKAAIARFEAEQQALALMDHSNVAKVFDAGTTDAGRLYFVMEHVQGVRINRYCDTERLSTEERLELFVTVCEAIQHAHQNGIIHRDIKPSNVLVMIQDGRPVPKVIDFGVAKAVKHRLTEKTLFTEQGQLIGTPEYMSPEQAEMSGLNVDTRTDIYSLGVLLYELLTGSLPFDPNSVRSAAFGEFQRIIREDEPSKPSMRLSSMGDVSRHVARNRHAELAELRRELRGDLDWITMKAMEKNRTRRYASASELAADIRRHLRHEPVLAGPPSASYRIKKFIQRHKAGAAATFAVTLALLAGIISTSWMAVIASQQRRVAQREAAIARAVNEFLNDDLLASVAPGERGPYVTVREVLDAASQNVEGKFGDEPLVEASIRMTLANTYWYLGEYEAAVPHVERALALRKVELGLDDPDTLDSMNTEAVLYKDLGRFDEAESLYRKTLATRRRVLGIEHPTTLSSINNFAVFLRRQNKIDEAAALHREALAVRERVLPEDHPDTLNSMANLAAALCEEVKRNKAKLDEAEPLAREALKARKRVLGTEDPYTLHSMHILANILAEKGEHADAEQLYRQALEAARRVFGDEHPRVAAILYELARVALAKGDYGAAELMLRGALAIRRQRRGEAHWKTGITKSRLGEALMKLGRLEEAEQELLAAYQTLEASVGNAHAETIKAAERLVALYDAWDKPDRAADWRGRVRREDDSGQRANPNP